MPTCIVPGCPLEAGNNLGIRLRRPDTSAIWAPNTEAYVCDQHALSGARVTIIYEPADTGQVEVVVNGAAPAVARRTTIHRRAEASESLSEELVARARPAEEE